MKNRIKLSIFLTAVSLILSACGSKGGGGDTATSLNDPLIGTYFMSGVESTTGDIIYLAATVGPNNTISFVSMRAPKGSPWQFYYRQNYGTYTKINDTLFIDWSYETCNPQHSESVQVLSQDPSDRIFVKTGVTTYQMLNSDKWTSDIDVTNTFLTFTEDVNCNQMPN